MHVLRLQLSDSAYNEAKRRAAVAGEDDVEKYISEVLVEDFGSSSENLDHLFTADRLAIIDKAIGELDRGESYSAKEVEEHFRKRFQA